MENKSEQPQTKDRIFKTARRLFARQGFAATGVRQIAREAEVNLAMINYFFGSKTGLLKAILEDFFTGLISMAEQSGHIETGPDQRLRNFIRSLTAYFRSKPDSLAIAITEIPKDDEEITRFRIELISRFLPVAAPNLLAPIAGDITGNFPLPALGPMLAFMLASQFIVGPILDKSKLLNMDDNYYEQLPDIVTNLLLYGLTGHDKWTFQSDKNEA